MRTLSPQQEKYANYFFALLDQYGVDSPAQLDSETKSEFFSRIKSEWKKYKNRKWENIQKDMNSQMESLSLDQKIQLLCEQVSPESLSEGDREKYQQFFRDTLAQYGVDSPAELDDEQKKKFFNDIDQGWESNIEEQQETYPVEDEDEEVIASIAEGKGYKLVSIRGRAIKEGKNDRLICEVSKFGNRETIVYDDNNPIPWCLVEDNSKRFKYLESALDYITHAKAEPSYRAKKTLEEFFSAKALFEDETRPYASQTTNLPAKEEQRRNQRGLKIMEKLLNGKFEQNLFE